jgi:septum formation protein
MRLILASGSPARKALLSNAGLRFEAVPAELDERAAEQPLLQAGASPEDVALALAMAKASLVSERHPDALVIGADQTLDLDGRRLTKPADMEAARRQILSLSGRTHRLHSAVSCASAGTVLWRDVSSASLTMRVLEPAFIGRYLAAAGDSVFGSVGAYQLEGPGIQLFDRIDGDYFTILGLPMLPLLKNLRAAGAIE